MVGAMATLLVVFDFFSQELSSMEKFNYNSYLFFFKGTNKLSNNQQEPYCKYYFGSIFFSSFV